MRVTFIAFSMALMMVGCSGSSSGNHAASGIDSACTKADGGPCLEYVMTTPDLQTSLEASCLDDGAQIVSSCRHEGLIGICTLPIGTTGASSRDYFYAGSAANLESACVGSHGTWTPGS